VRRFVWTSGLAVTAATLLAIVGAPAPVAQPPDTKLAPASARLAGFTGGELLGEEIRQLLEIPAADNPLNDAGESCFAAGHKDKVLIVWTRPEAPTCTVKPGTPIFLFALFNSCSDVETPFPTSEAEQRQCAVAGLRQFAADLGAEALLVSIDGAPSIDIFSDRCLAISPQMTANLPVDNILGVPAQATTFVAAGWVAMIRPLPPGTHTIRVEVVQSGDDFVSEAIVEVVPGRR
jgi:hypothetical protein